MQMLAAIDVGSGEVAMKIYEFSKEQGVREVEYVRSIVELGADTYNTGIISGEMTRELIRVLRGFVEKLREYKIDNYIAYASSAMREATNRDLILDQIRLHTGLQVRVISNAQQRFMILQSLAGLMKRFETLTEEGVGVIDLSSGSLQVSIFTEGNLQVTQNLKLGSLRVREILADIEQRTTSFINVMEDYIGNDLKTLERLVIRNYRVRHVIVIGEAMATMLNEINMAKKRESFTSKQFEKFYTKLMRSSKKEIIQKFGIPYETATVLRPSMIIFKKLVDMLGAKEVWASNVGLCDGIVFEYLNRKHLIEGVHDFTGDILTVTTRMAEKYESDKEHTQVVVQLSMIIFDSIRKISGLEARDRVLLQVAAILHDCGKFVNMKRGSENAYFLVQNTEIIGLSDAEKEIVANIIRYNSMIEVPGYECVAEVMTHEDYVRMLKMAAILRLANGMDRSHQQRIQKVDVTVKDDELKILADTIYDITLERGLMENRSHFFEQIFGLKPVLRQKRRG